MKCRGVLERQDNGQSVTLSLFVFCLFDHLYGGQDSNCQILIIVIINKGIKKRNNLLLTSVRTILESICNTDQAQQGLYKNDCTYVQKCRLMRFCQWSLWINITKCHFISLHISQNYVTVFWWLFRKEDTLWCLSQRACISLTWISGHIWMTEGQYYPIWLEQARLTSCLLRPLICWLLKAIN